MKKRRHGVWPPRVMRDTPAMVRGIADLTSWAGADAWDLVEIGSFAGESAALFALTDAYRTITCVDHWRLHADDLPIVRTHFEQRARGFGLHHLHMPSTAAAERYADGSLDMVYIDGWHGYDAVVSDIQAWRSKVRPGGVLAGHDHDPEQWPDVVRAVQDLLGGPHATFQDTSWAVRL